MNIIAEMESEATSVRNLTEEEMKEIKLLLFGESTAVFTDAWTKQGLSFKSFPSYGLKQKRAGPCGIIAAVQAFVIDELLYGDSRIALKDGYLRPTITEGKHSLAKAITNILWKAKSGSAVHIVSSRKSYERIKESEKFEREKIQVKCIESLNSLHDHIKSSITMFMNSGGIIYFMYSLILTRGVDKIREDMDFPENSWIGYDSYSSQEAVNLILIGQAISNVFNGNKELNTGNESIVFKGIPGKSKIGFLSLSDYENNDPVGTFYKNPEHPVWVLNANSHYLVLFGTSKSVLDTDKEFQLLYTDSLGLCEEIRLRINPNDPPEDVEKLPGTIKCIRTRWPHSRVQVDLVSKE